MDKFDIFSNLVKEVYGRDKYLHPLTSKDLYNLVKQTEQVYSYGQKIQNRIEPDVEQ